MHLPHPLCQLVVEFWDAMFQQYMGARTTVVNGYGYSTQPTPRPPTREMIERGVFDVWTKDYLPQIRAACEGLRGRDYDAMSAADLGEELPHILTRAVKAFGFTMKPISAFMEPTFGFVTFLSEELGADGPRLGATMLQGYENGTAAAGAGLSTLADEAAKRPAVADALRRGDFEALAGGEARSSSVACTRTWRSSVGASIAGGCWRSRRGRKTRIFP
jgi:hypothetical protein